MQQPQPFLLWEKSQEQQIQVLNALDAETFASAMRDSLNDSNNPCVVFPSRDEIQFVLMDYARISESLGRKIKSNVHQFIRESDSKNDNPLYLYRLIYLAGMLGVKEAYGNLLERAERSEYKDITVTKNLSFPVNLHRHCLQALGGMAPLDDERLKRVCLRDIQNERSPEYFGICYHILYARFSEPSRHIREYFPRLVELSMSGRHDFCNEFHFIHKYPASREAFLRGMGSIFKKLSPEQLVFVDSEIKKRKTRIEDRQKEPRVLKNSSRGREGPDGYLAFLRTVLDKIGQITIEPKVPKETLRQGHPKPPEGPV